MLVASLVMLLRTLLGLGHKELVRKLKTPPKKKRKFCRNDNKKAINFWNIRRGGKQKQKLKGKKGRCKQVINLVDYLLKSSLGSLPCQAQKN